MSGFTVHSRHCLGWGGAVPHCLSLGPFNHSGDQVSYKCVIWKILRGAHSVSCSPSGHCLPVPAQAGLTCPPPPSSGNALLFLTVGVGEERTFQISAACER